MEKLVMHEKVNKQFWAGKRVFLTGHTGFKGGWLTAWLTYMGARVTGYALAPITNPSFFNVVSLGRLCERSHIGDIRNLQQLKSAIKDAEPQILIHMAAQPLVRESYINPIETYSTNVIGTANVLEAIRSCNSIKSVVIVSSDKCYENQDWVWGYRESDPLGGYDPYSSSKGCAELVTQAYRQSFFPENDHHIHGVAIASARAGNVIGGGDWSADRLIPDAIKAFEANAPLMIRNPFAIRPWQHVLEPLSGYLLLAERLYTHGPAFNGGWNFGPQDSSACSVKDIVEMLIGQWKGRASWKLDGGEQPHEANLLRLDCSKANYLLGWRSVWELEVAIDRVLQWYKSFQDDENMLEVTFSQIEDYLTV